MDLKSTKSDLQNVETEGLLTHSYIKVDDIEIQDEKDESNCKLNICWMNKQRDEDVFHDEETSEESEIEMVINNPKDNLPETAKVDLKDFIKFKYKRKSKIRPNLNSHIKAANKSRKQFKCERCDYIAPYKCSLTKHVNSVHEKTTLFQCTKCTYKSAFISNVNRHSSVVHKGSRPQKCPHCNYECVNKQNLTNHINAVHNGVTPFKCKQCDYESSFQCNLKRHVRARH